MHHLLSLLIVATLLSACTPIQYLSAALISSEDKAAAEAERRSLQRQRYRAYYCTLSKSISPAPSDTPDTTEQIRQHNERRATQCQPNLSE